MLTLLIPVAILLLSSESLRDVIRPIVSWSSFVALLDFSLPTSLLRAYV
jgi:hypothetical protein